MGRRYSKCKFKRVPKKKAAVISIIWVLLLVIYGLLFEPENNVSGRNGLSAQKS